MSFGHKSASILSGRLLMPTYNANSPRLYTEFITQEAGCSKWIWMCDCSPIAFPGGGLVLDTSVWFLGGPGPLGGWQGSLAAPHILSGWGGSGRAGGCGCSAGLGLRSSLLPLQSEICRCIQGPSVPQFWWSNLLDRTGLRKRNIMKEKLKTHQPDWSDHIWEWVWEFSNMFHTFELHFFAWT